MNAQVLRGGDPEQLAAMQGKLALAGRMRAGIGWFYWIAGLSLVNSGAYFFGATLTFVVGLGFTQFIDAIMSAVAKELGEGWGLLRPAGLVLDVLIAGVFVLIGYLGRKGIRWLVIAGMVLYALDAVLLLLLKDFFAVAFHGWALYGIWTGLKAMQALQDTANMQSERVVGPGPMESSIRDKASVEAQDGRALDPAGRMEKLEQAYSSFAAAANALSPGAFLRSLGDWTPRDVVAHLIGWNRYILTGCEQIRSGISPFYHKDGLNDYRQINAVSIARYNSTDCGVLLNELADSKDELITYLRGLNELDWYKDYGPRHYRGGPATVARSIESLTGDYINHTAEMARAAK